MAQKTFIGLDRIVYSTERDLFDQAYETHDWDRKQNHQGLIHIFVPCEHQLFVHCPYKAQADKQVSRTKPDSQLAMHPQNRKNEIQSHPCTKTITKSKKSRSETVMNNTVEGESGSGREKLKRHRMEVAGRVWIPDIWGQEDLLKDWIDCAVFDSPVIGSSVVSARASLIEEGMINANSAIKNGVNIHDI